MAEITRIDPQLEITRELALARVVELIRSPANRIRNHLIKRAVPLGGVIVYTGPLVMAKAKSDRFSEFRSRENRVYRKLRASQERNRQRGSLPNP